MGSSHGRTLPTLWEYRTRSEMTYRRSSIHPEPGPASCLNAMTVARPTNDFTLISIPLTGTWLPNFDLPFLLPSGFDLKPWVPPISERRRGWPARHGSRCTTQKATGSASNSSGEARPFLVRHRIHHSRTYQARMRAAGTAGCGCRSETGGWPELQSDVHKQWFRFLSSYFESSRIRRLRSPRR